MFEFKMFVTALFGFMSLFVIFWPMDNEGSIKKFFIKLGFMFLGTTFLVVGFLGQWHRVIDHGASPILAILINYIIPLAIAYFLFFVANVSDQVEKRQQDESERNVIEQKNNAYQQQLQEIEDREHAKAKGQAKAMLSLYEGQLKLLQEHRRQGFDIEREAFELQEKLFALETQQNKQMVEDMLRTLEDMRR